VLKTSRLVFNLHRHAQTGPHAASDPNALFWVYATLIDYGVLAFELFVRELSEGEKQVHYDFLRETAVVWGVDPAALPPSWSGFNSLCATYWRSFVAWKTKENAPYPKVWLDLFQSSALPYAIAFHLLPAGAGASLFPRPKFSSTFTSTVLALFCLAYQSVASFFSFRFPEPYRQWVKRQQAPRS